MQSFFPPSEKDPVQESEREHHRKTEEHRLKTEEHRRKAEAAERDDEHRRRELEHRRIRDEEAERTRRLALLSDGARDKLVRRERPDGSATGTSVRTQERIAAEEDYARRIAPLRAAQERDPVRVVRRRSATPTSHCTVVSSRPPSPISGRGTRW